MAKSTAKKPTASKSKKATVTAKSSVKTGTSNKLGSQVSSDQSLLYVLLSIGVTYLFASLAIDSGNLWYYVLAFAGLYYIVSFSKKYIKQKFNHDKPKRKSARKA